jgi:cytochrome c-type biogenesis protein CcmF
MPHLEPVVSLPLMGIAVTLGNLAIWLGLASAISCVVLYWAAMLRTMRRHPEGSREQQGAAPAAAATHARGNGNGHANGNGKPKGKARANGGPRPDPVSPEEQEIELIGLWARRFFFITGGFVVLGVLCLWTMILTQQYTLEYVNKNSNTALPFGYRFASFWSDQEGTFFLWAIYNTILGSILVLKSRKDERWVMPFFTLVNVSLFALLTFMNPFWLVKPEEVRHGLESVGLQPEGIGLALPTTMGQHLAWYFGWARYINPQLFTGHGLNEQLQNFWFVIHPPTLFIGYASMIVPGCFALGALMRRDYDSWVNRAAPWLMFTWTVLGIGIFLGAYWAYETLGWGGYWSWDPVENASFIPWLVGTALLHGLLAQRNRGNFKQANLFLGVMTSNAVLLGSFLVRSGVLDGISVHAFARPQQGVFYVLLAILVLWFAMSVAIWAWRFKDIQSEIAYEHAWERHFGFFLGLIVLSASAIVILFGVFAAPVLLPMILHKKLNIEFTFYNKALLPVVFVMAGLMAITPLMPWRHVPREDGREPRPNRPFNQVALALAGLIAVFFVGAAVYAWSGAFKLHNDPAYLAFGMMLGLALLTNTVCLARASRGGLLNMGPWLAHIGFVVMMLGVLVSSRFNTTVSVRKIEQGQSVRIMGRDWYWDGQRPAASPADRERMLIRMVQNGKTVLFDPKLFVSKINGNTMAWPQIRSEWLWGALGDIYVEPTGVDTSGMVTAQEVRKGDRPVEVRVQHRLSDPEEILFLSFNGLDTSEMQRAMQQAQGSAGAAPKPWTVYADVTLNINGVDQHFRPACRMSLGQESLQYDPIPLRVPGLKQSTGYSLLFQKSNLKPGELTADFALTPDVPVSQGYFQVLHVPGIQVLWFGCYIMFFGAALSYLRRTKLVDRPVGAGSRDAKSRPEGRLSGAQEVTPAPEPSSAE